MWIGFDQPQTIMGGGYAAEVAVPLWAGFMRKATAGDPADWYKAPQGHRRRATSAACPASARSRLLRRATIIDDDGEDDDRVDGLHRVLRQRHRAGGDCALHGSRSIFSRMAGWVGGRSPSPGAERADAEVRADADARRAQRVDARRADDPPAEAHSRPKKKKRGFWSRVFGVGKTKKSERRQGATTGLKDDRSADERSADR